MYEKLKNITKKIIPQKFLKKHEDKLRKLVAYTYKGDNYTCNVCETKLSKFIELENKELLCPNCGCLPRTRRLLTLIESEVNLPNKKLLHFSPPKALRNKLSQLELGTYITTDYEGEFDADKRLNIESISEPDNQYDIIVCYHVLEHIVKDELAIGELYRILKPNGICFIQTPFKSGDIYENYSIITKAERLKHFGQDDHVRIYSSNGLKTRLEQKGFEVEVLNFEKIEENRNGFSKTEIILKAVKKG